MRKAFVAGTAIIIGGTIAASAGIAPAQDQQPQAQPAGLPDLVMLPIKDVKAYPWLTDKNRRPRGRWAIRFTSTLGNGGPGHLIIHGHRAATGTPCTPQIANTNKCEKRRMVADQIVVNADGTTTTVPHVGTLYFDQAHFHWHFRGVSRYELRSANGRRVLRRDRKTGFCFGDRFAQTSPRPVEYPGLEDGLATCLYGSTSDPSKDGRRALELTEGISAGFADDYDSFHNGVPLQGQELELTRLKAGSYVLVNRTNVTGKIREITKANDVASVLFRLRWPHGPRRRPAVKVLANCPGKAVCKPTRSG